MIEMVYNGKESKGQSEVRLPKNIRQIGDNNSKKKIAYEKGRTKISNLCVIVVIRLVMWHFIALCSAFCNSLTSLCDKIRHFAKIFALRKNAIHTD